jgi:hypothetical protein
MCILLFLPPCFEKLDKNSPKALSFFLNTKEECSNINILLIQKQLSEVEVGRSLEKFKKVKKSLKKLRRGKKRKNKY